jgi:hypothetical protein
VFRQRFLNATVNGQWWYWKVKADDGTTYTWSSVYKFYTGHQSKIENTGSTTVKGYLLMQIQHYNQTLKQWVLVDNYINENTSRTINTGAQLGLDTIFNGIVNTLDLSPYNNTYFIYTEEYKGYPDLFHIIQLNPFEQSSSYENGTYRLHVAFRDPYGNTLETDDKKSLTAWWEFRVQD